MYSRNINLLHQWYWSYQYPDFLDSSAEFIEFDSYIVPDSDLEITKVIVATPEFDQNLVLYKVGLDYIMEDETLRRIIDQVRLNRWFNVYSKNYPISCQLNTFELRNDFANRIAASGDPGFTVETAETGEFSGERIVKRPNGRLVIPNLIVVELLRDNL